MDTLLIERSNGVVTVTMNRPERKNAANARMLEELRQTFEAVERSATDRAMVLTGAGGEFCSGADLTEPGADEPGYGGPGLVSMRRLGDVALALHRLTTPTIAKVDGVAVGAGLSLALGCDLVVLSQRARLSTIFAKRALSLDNGQSWLLPRLVGMAKAKELALFGDMLSAEEAMAMGLANRVLPVGDLDDFVTGWAERLARGPTLALSMTKTLLHSSLSSSMEQAVEHEAACQAVNFVSADTAEAMTAFLQKRDPTFVGR